jgi:hypothetical protein
MFDSSAKTAVMEDPVLRTDVFAQYMQKVWPKDGSAPPDAAKYILTEEQEDEYEKVIYAEPAMTLQQFLNSLKEESEME